MFTVKYGSSVNGLQVEIVNSQEELMRLLSTIHYTDGNILEVSYQNI